ncbi:hypothetical protein ABZ860_16780 [Microbispora sp. NPDC046973]|uniref:hypothetical protein n=1 Tax=Microbispora sp. NPDC046973 TaxID=3155022 RepID=UPI0033D26A47
MNPEEAARSLATIRQTQAKAMRAQPWLSTWWVTTVGLLITGILAVVEPGRLPVPMIVLGVLLLCAAMAVLGAVYAKTRPMSVSDRTIRRDFSVLYLPWLFGGILLNYAVSFPLAAAHVPYGMACGGVALTLYFALGSRPISRAIARRTARRFEEDR